MYKSKFIFASLFLIIALSMILTPFTPAQTVSLDREDNAVLVTLNAGVDSLGITTSNWFSVSDLLSHSLYTYPIHYTKKQLSVAGTPVATVTIEGSNDQTNVAIVDTIGGVGDNAETLYSGTANFNNKKFWYYRIKYTGGTGNRSDTNIITHLLFIRPKN